MIHRRRFPTVAMPLVLLRAVLIAPLWWLTPIHAQPPSPAPFDERAHELVVMVTAELAGTDTFGAGIIVGHAADRLYIVTADHVVRRGATTATNIRVMLKSLPGEPLPTTLQADHDETMDLAVLRVPDVRRHRIPVQTLPFDRLGSATNLPRAASVYPVGYPRGRPWGTPLTPDRFDRVRGDRIIFESNFIREGHSGGGLFTERGELIGLLVSDQAPYGEALSMASVIAALRDWNYPVNLSTAAVPAAPGPERPAPPGALNSARVVFVTDRPDRTQALVEYLKQQGAVVSVTSTADLAAVASARPDLVIVGADTRDYWKTQSKAIVRRLFEGYRVLGLGEGGSGLFFMLDLKLAGVMHTNSTEVAIHVPELLRTPLAVAASERTVDVAVRGGDVIGVYDFGSPAVGGFEGIGRWPAHPNHWPIARQGQYALWGFTASADQLTESGKRLFANLLAEHRTRPLATLSQLTKVEYVKPGLISERLTAQFSKHEWFVQLRRPGRIQASLLWQPAERGLALILNGPGQVGYFSRKDGTSPLVIEFEATAEHVSKGSDWRISVSAFGSLEKAIDYRLDLSFPTD